MNIYVSEAAIPQIVAIRFCTLEKKERIRVPPFRYLGCVMQCAVFPAHSCPSYTSLVLARFLIFVSQSTNKLPLKHGPKTTYFLALVNVYLLRVPYSVQQSSATLSNYVFYSTCSFFVSFVSCLISEFLCFYSFSIFCVALLSRVAFFAVLSYPVL